MAINLRDLEFAIESIRHRGLQKRIDGKDPDVPKVTKLNGKDWQPCQVCAKEAYLIYEFLKDMSK